MFRRKRSAVKRSPATGRARQAVTPPRNVNAESVDEVTSKLSSMGVSVTAQKNAKYDTVDINDAKYQEVILVNDGISNPGDIDARLLCDVPTGNGDMMQVYKLTIPVHGTRLNKDVVHTKFWLVVTEDGRKAVEMESPVCFKRYNRDALMIEVDCENEFGKHEGRDAGLKANTAEKMALADKVKGPLVNYTLLVLPEGVEREETADEDEDLEVEAGTVSYVLFSNCEFSHHKGKAPEDGRLKFAFTLEPGDDEEDFLVFGSAKVPFPTAYFTVHIALDGTQEKIANFGGEDSPEKLDADKWMRDREARRQEKKRAAGGGGMSDDEFM